MFNTGEILSTLQVGYQGCTLRKARLSKMITVTPLFPWFISLPMGGHTEVLAIVAAINKLRVSLLVRDCWGTSILKAAKMNRKATKYPTGELIHWLLLITSPLDRMCTLCGYSPITSVNLHLLSERDGLQMYHEYLLPPRAQIAHILCLLAFHWNSWLWCSVTEYSTAFCSRVRGGHTVRRLILTRYTTLICCTY